MYVINDTLLVISTVLLFLCLYILWSVFFLILTLNVIFFLDKIKKQLNTVQERLQIHVFSFKRDKCFK